MFLSNDRRNTSSEYGLSEFYTQSNELLMATHQYLRGYAVKESDDGSP